MIGVKENVHIDCSGSQMSPSVQQMAICLTGLCETVQVCFVLKHRHTPSFRRCPI